MSTEKIQLPAELMKLLSVGIHVSRSASLERAAVVGSFDLNWLDQQTGGKADERSTVLNAAEPLDKTLDRWRLRAGERERQLVELAREPERLRERLAEAVPQPEDRTGHALQAMLRGDATPAADEEPALEAALEAASWLAGVEALPSPDPRAIRRQLSRHRLVRELAEMAQRFVGREDALRRLEVFAEEPSRNDGWIPVLPVAGIGGIGKSVLLARFLSKRIAPTDPGDGRPLPFHLDFDRLGAATASEVEWTFELNRQLAFHVPALAPDLDRTRREAQDAYARSDAGSSADGPPTADTGSQSVALEAAITATDLVTADLFWRARGRGLGFRRLLLLFDTVEALQTRSVDGLSDLANWIRSLRDKGGFADIRVVLCGRVPAVLPMGGFTHERPLELDELAPAHARELLGRLGLDAEQSRVTVEEFGGNPLVLRLVSQLSRRANVDLSLLARDPEARRGADREVAQGVLYRRILEHVQSGPVAELAHPGLAARRVDVRLIQHVIAPLCLNHPIDTEEARRLYDALSREVWLVEPAPDGSDAVVHRGDLRRLTMRLIARDPREAERAESIHRAAVAYYEQGEGCAEPHAVGEALYHRFMVRDRAMLPPLDSVTAHQARDAIGAGIEELPRENLVALRAALDEGVELQDALLLPEQLWEAFLRKRGDELVRRDAFDAALGLVELRPLPSGKLAGDWQVVALDAEARWGELFERLTAVSAGWGTDAEGMRQFCAWLIAGRKAGMLPRLTLLPPGSMLPPTLPPGVSRVLSRASVAEPDGALALSVRAYLLRCGWPAPPWRLSLSTSELLRDGALARELVRYFQAGGKAFRFRPIRSQFLPSLPWLRGLVTVAGPVAQEPISKIVIALESTGGAGLSIAQYLGHLSENFEAAWVDAYVRGEIPREARVQLLAVRDFAEFRAPARVALTSAFDTLESLTELIERFRPLLPLVPIDLLPAGLPRFLSNPQDAVANLVAFADRCQLLHQLLTLGLQLRPSARRTRQVLDGLERWFTAEEATNHVRVSSDIGDARGRVPSRDVELGHRGEPG